jgi:hypothetical protein
MKYRRLHKIFIVKCTGCLKFPTFTIFFPISSRQVKDTRTSTLLKCENVRYHTVVTMGVLLHPPPSASQTGPSQEHSVLSNIKQYCNEHE